MSEIIAKYHCTQPELYAICNLGWNFIKNRQAQIVLTYPEYTVVYIDGQILLITEAEAIKGEQERDLITETDRIDLLALAAPAITNWNLLERYINRAFKNNKPLIKPNVEAAGKEYYATATKEEPNWEDLKQMLLDGKEYITENTAILTPVVPATFFTEYNDAAAAFITKYNTFLTDKLVSPETTADKLIANNNIYDELLFALADLRQIAPPHMQDNLTFAHLKLQVSTPGTAGLRFDVRQQGTNVPLEAVLATIQKEGGLILNQTTDAEGKAQYPNLEPGTYKGTLELTGFQKLDITFTITTGVTSFKHWLLTPNP